jgi:hypothetical protein
MFHMLYQKLLSHQLENKEYVFRDDVLYTLFNIHSH